MTFQNIGKYAKSKNRGVEVFDTANDLTLDRNHIECSKMVSLFGNFFPNPMNSTFLKFDRKFKSYLRFL